MPAGCLVTSVPEFEEQAQTPPFLIASSAIPDIREFLLVEDGDVSLTFSAQVLSEDRGVPVQVAIYIDYGKENMAGNPWKRVVAEYPSIAPGTLEQGARRFNVTWYPDADFFNGCHTITMMVTHEFDFRRCPMRLKDSSHLVWQVLRCSTKESCGTIDPFTSCPNSTVDPLVECPEEAPGLEDDAGGGGSP